MAGPSLTISHVKSGDQFAAYDFHVRNAGEYLWPRSEEEFVQLLASKQLFLAKREREVVGLCYVKDDGERWEFGGIYLLEDLRGLGAGAALGRVAIATCYLFHDPPELIAHVHEFNNSPRRLLTAQFGFEATGETEIPPAELAPPSMKRNADEQVVGEVFRHRRESLAEVADWIEAFDGHLHGKQGAGPETFLELDLWKHRDEYVPALRELASD